MSLAELKFLLPLFIIGITFILLGVYVIRREKSPRSKMFITLMGIISFWYMVYILELWSKSFSSIVFWYKMTYIGKTGVPVFWFIFGVQFYSKKTEFSKRNIILLLVVSVFPVINQILIWTNPYHSLFWKDMTLEQIGPLTQIVPVYGLNFWYHAIYSYLLVVAGSYFLIKKLFSFERKLRKQAFAIGVGVFFPLIGNIVYSLGYNPLVIRLTPILFIVTGITFTWGIFRYHFLNITQIATRTIFEHIRDAIFVLNIEDQVIDVNPYGLELMDLQIVGSSMKKIFGSKAEEFFRKNIDLIAIINNPDKDNKEIKIEHNGEELYFDTRISPIFNKKQNAIGKVVILRDITNIKNTERRLIKTEKLAALGGLVAGVAHEINTPVGISITASSTLMEETDKMVGLYKEDKINRVNFKEYLSMANQTAKLILSNMERTATMIQSFKLVSVDQSTGQQRIFNLKEYTFDVIRSLYPRLKNRKIKIVLDMDDKIDLDSFPGAFSQIITNLVLNSLTHGFKEKEKGKIEIMAKLDKKELVLEYSDYGRGIHEEHMGTIFEPFFTTDKKMGTGLGLYIIYNIVTQKLNGSIECTSELNKRTTFLIKIPVRD